MAVIGQFLGPAVPPGFVAQPFNCPAGSDFDKSREVGMCVGPGYGPMYTTEADGTRTYYNLDGSVGGQDRPGAPPKSVIGGIPDMYLIVGAAILMLLLLGRRR